MTFRYFIKISYNGANYHGWQLQQNAHSVQEEINRALSILLKEHIETLGAGRTDTGVHASHYVAHFDTSKPDLGNSAGLLHSLNRILPSDISIFWIRPVKPTSHARFDALSRTYKYCISRRKDPFSLGLAWQYSTRLNVEQMNLAAAQLLYFNDFTSLSKVGSDNKTTICKVTDASWTEEGDLLVFRITADRFLRNMVRALVGTMVDVGRGKISAEVFSGIIEARNRSLAGPSAPAEGLFLTGIEYPETVWQ